MEKSIEERAKEAQREITRNKDWGDVAYGYEKGATEQKAIDIEKACDAYCNLHCNADTRWMCRNNPISRCTTFEVIKKAMEE